MKNLLAFQPMHAVIDASTTMEVRVPLATLGFEIGDTFRTGFGHVRRGVAITHPGFAYTLSKDNLCVAPMLDGHMDTGEWAKAKQYPLVQADGSLSDPLVTGYMMHDANYLYVAVTGQIPHNGFIAFGMWKEGLFTPNKKYIVVLTDGGTQFWETQEMTNGDWGAASREDGSAIYDSALGFDGMLTRKVFIQLIGANGKALRARGCVLSYLSDDAHGNSVCATKPSTDTVIGTDGLLLALTGGEDASDTGLVAHLISESDGDIDLVLVNDVTDTFYLVLVLPNGRLVISDAIEFST